MNYEKAYKEALERARKIHSEIVNNELLGFPGQIEDIFPQLRESEDEKIRKEIIDIVEAYRANCVYEGTHRFDDCLAWLERQKEHQNNSDAREKALGRDLTFPQDKDKNLDEIAQDYVDGVKEYNPEPTWDLMQTAVCYGYHYCEQKEQKPKLIGEDSVEKMARQMYENGQTIEEQKPEWSDEDEENFKWFDKFFRAESIMLDGRDIPQDKYLWFKSLRPQKLDASKLENFDPVDVLKRIKKEWPVAWERVALRQVWSEEDKKLIDDVMNSLCCYQNTLSHYQKEIVGEEIRKLKSLKPQPKQEWSEEDEKYLSQAIETLEHENYLVLAEKLKSLRPQPKDEIYKEKYKAFKLGKHQLAIEFMNYLDNNRPEGKMSLSNGECEDIDKAFKENDWAKIMRYVEKYSPSWRPTEEQMEALKCAILDVAKFSKRGGRQVEFENEPYYMALHSLYEHLKKSYSI